MKRLVFLKYLKIRPNIALKIIALDYQIIYKTFCHNNNTAKSFDILAISLSVLYNYFDGSTELFSDLYLA